MLAGMSLLREHAVEEEGELPRVPKSVWQFPMLGFVLGFPHEQYEL